MTIERIDLNLLGYLDVLLRERSVTKAADHLSLSQPALSNSLRRLRTIFDDPLLVRTSDGMTPTRRALEVQPLIREVLETVDRAIVPRASFDPLETERVFRIAASDYAESMLLPRLLQLLRSQAPGVALDVMTPSDVTFPDVELGKVDLVVNRFHELPQSFHQKELWEDDFSCLISTDNPILDDFTLMSYLDARHVWVSKTGMGVGVGVNPDDVQRLGWVDAALHKLGKQRKISVFTRHYQTAMLLAEGNDLIVTLPSKAALSQSSNPRLAIRKPPFEITPITLQMAWSPLLQHDASHQWLRRIIVSIADTSPER